jgi:anaerobic ribonucleoside-triphosphate reductase
MAFGHVTVAAELSDHENPESVVELLRKLAAETHVRGLTMVGSIRLCKRCGLRTEETMSVCPTCGGESVYELERKERGTKNRIARL